MTSAVPILHQPIYIQPEEKKSKPPPGGSLYNDVYNSYRGFEHLYLLSASPLAYTAGAIGGLLKSAFSYCQNGAPKKIAQDSEIIDFSATVHSKGVIGMLKIIGKKFFLGVYPLANIDRMSTWNDHNIGEITQITWGIKHGFVAIKASQLFDEIIQRMANWVDVPAK